MSEPKFTSGPWHIVPYGDGDTLVICTAPDGDWRICFMATPGDSPRAMEKIEANAHMISSAPEMFEALAHIDAYYDMNDLDEREDDDAIEVPVGDLRRARSALAKARGEV